MEATQEIAPKPHPANPEHARRLRRLKDVSKFNGVLILLAASTVLIGWTYQDELLKRMSPGFVTMNPVTALGFLAGGIALCLYPSDWGREEGTPLPGRILAVSLLVIGALKLADYALGWSFHFDEVLFHDQLMNDHAGTGNQIAPNAAFNFVLGGTGLIFLYSARGRFSAWTQNLSLALFFISSVSLVGYLYGEHTLYRIAGRTPMAFHTSVCFCFLALGMMFAQAGGGIVGLLAGRTPGSFSARLLLPTAFVLPIVLGGLRLFGAKAGWYSPEAGVAVMFAALSAIFSILVWKDAERLDRMDRERSASEDRLREARDELERRIRERTASLQANAEALQSRIAELETERDLFLGGTRGGAMSRIIPPSTGRSPRSEGTG